MSFRSVLRPACRAARLGVKTRASVALAVIDTLEARRLMAVTVPEGYVKIDSLSVESANAAKTGAEVATGSQTLKSGVSYFLKASGTWTCSWDPRQADAKFHQELGNPGNWVTYGNGLTVNGSSDWGVTQVDADHQYGKYVTGNDAPLSAFMHDYWNGAPAYYDNSGSVNIDIYEQLPVVTITSTADGAEDGTTPVKFSVSRTGPTSSPLVVNLAIAGGTATEGSDYSPPSSSITIPAGSPSATLEITTLADIEEETDETVLVQVASDGVAYTTHPSGSILVRANAAMAVAQQAPAPAEAEGRIKDDGFLAAVRQRIAQEEGDKLTVYDDTAVPPNKTVGIGHNMGPEGVDVGKAEFERATGANYDDVKAGRTDLTEAQKNALFKADLEKHLAQVRGEVANFDKLPLGARVVLTDMAFNMGSLSKFNDLKEAIGRKDYRQAAWDIGHKSRLPNSGESNYLKQVRARASRNIAIMEALATAAGQ